MDVTAVTAYVVPDNICVGLTATAVHAIDFTRRRFA
jgi:hypothetical protein